MSGLDAVINRPRPSWIQLFMRAPYITLAKTLLVWRTPAPWPRSKKVTCVCTSDTHNSQPTTPHGDVLIHAGDLTQTGTLAELQQSLDWLNRQSHEHIVVIAGNHDFLLDSNYSVSQKDQKDRDTLAWGRIIYLQDSSTTLHLSDGSRLKIYGSPWTRKHGNWAFQFPASQSGGEEHFSKIPPETDVLVTHMPPRFHLDVNGWGDEALLRNLKQVRPQLHVFGHVHEGYGRRELQFDSFEARYEGVCRGNEGLWALFLMAWSLLWARVGVASKSTLPSTLLVNPSAVGGLRDHERRRPIVVEVGCTI